jgi:protein AroM
MASAKRQSREQAMTRRAAFVTIGQSPRDDIVPAMRERIGSGLEIVEHGALDTLSRAEISAIAPRAGEHRLVTRLRDGGEVVVGKAAMRDRLQALLDDLDRDGLEIIVLLCTGYFEGLRSRALLVEAQRVVDHLTQALTEGASRIGLLVPHAEQIAELHEIAPGRTGVKAAFASPYCGDRFALAGRELAECDLIVMHCMGYSEAMRSAVADASGRPVLLAQRMLAGAVAQLV